MLASWGTETDFFGNLLSDETTKVWEWIIQDHSQTIQELWYGALEKQACNLFGELLQLGSLEVWWAP